MNGPVCVDRKRRCDLAVTFGVTLGCCRRNCITHSPNNSLLLPLSIFRAKLHHTRRARARQFFSDRSTNKSSHFFVCQQPRAASTQRIYCKLMAARREQEREKCAFCVLVALCSNNMGARACERASCDDVETLSLSADYWVLSANEKVNFSSDCYKNGFAILW